MHRPILFVDSGIGGLPYLSALRVAAPYYKYTYIADREHFPYGLRSEHNLISIMERLLKRVVVHYQPLLVIIACNTASLTTIDIMRERFAVPFVGVVPAIKPAAKLSRKKNIALLSTTHSSHAEYLERLLNRYASDCQVSILMADHLVKMIEHRQPRWDADAIEIEDIAGRVKETGADTCVLGCTHFVVIQDIIKKRLPDDVRLVDSCRGVVDHALRLISNGAPGYREEIVDERSDQFLLTGDRDIPDCYRETAKLYQLEIGLCR